MQENCTNCNQIITNTYCDNCGQKKYSRLDKSYLIDEIKEILIYANKGFMYSVLKVAQNPGKTAKEFIDGKRINHYKPILLVFVLSGISALISYQVLDFQKIMSNYFTSQKVYSPFMADVFSFIASYNSFIMLSFIPMFALLTKIVFRKWGHNYYEHLVMNAYVLAFVTIIYILVFYPIAYFFKENPTIIYQVFAVSFFIIPFVLIWFFQQFYREHSFTKVILKILLLFTLTIVGYLLLIVLTTIILTIVIKLTGPGLLEYVKPQ
ncbi:MAG: DUF3667 domain-containing protein [Flavobacteriaceae bacterium]|nr:DUF3667 domain-containing protein [Flavobacteriaceae bacterium]